jgi:hypothetical protein
VKGIKKKDPAAVAFGRKGGKARARKLSAQELSEQARKAVAARWARRKGVPPSAGHIQSPNEDRRRAFLALAGSLSEEQAGELRQKVHEIREYWR